MANKVLSLSLSLLFITSLSPYKPSASAKAQQNVCDRLSFVDPDKPTSIEVAGITNTSVTVSWSIGETQVVNATTVYYRTTSGTNGEWETTSARTAVTTHEVTRLQPGTEYEFHVEIDSFGKTSKSDNINATTGMINYHLLFLATTFRL